MAVGLHRAQLQWLALLDELYALVESEGFSARAFAGEPADWPEAWQAVVRHAAARIGARSIQIGARPARQSPGRALGLVSRCRITARPANGPTLWADSLSPEGFTAEQAREFQAFGRHLHAALALRASLDAARQSLATLHDTIDALPMRLAMPDEGAHAARRHHDARDSAEPPALLAQELQLRYALSGKELLLAWNLAQGLPLKQYAALSGRSVETVRAQLKSVLRKLGIADQKGIGVLVFEALHALTLRSLGQQLPPFVAAPPARPADTTVPALPWR